MALGLAAAWSAPRPVAAHTPLPIYLQGKVTETEVTLRFVLSADLFREWLPIEASLLLGEDAAPEPLEGVRAGLESFFGRYARVKVDRLPVQGTLAAVTTSEYSDHGRLWAYVEVDVAYPTKGMPREVAIAWRNFDGGLGAIFDQVEGEIEGLGETSYYAFRFREPEVVWHAPSAAARIAPPPPWASRDHPAYYVSLLSLAILLGAGLLFLGLPAHAVRPLARWAVLGTGVALAVSLAGTGLVRVPGLGTPSDVRPAPAEALYLFESRLRNIYRAFDFETEDEVYDTLARSVTGDLLNHVYVEVYGSLILREEGGAVCKVQKVELLDASPAFPEGSDLWSVRAHWRVHGKVGHWGHTHMRVNEYVAVFTMAHREGAWKIAVMDVRSQERVDQGPR